MSPQVFAGKHREHQLLDRLDAIGESLRSSGHALALIGLGSVGVELERLDEYSDLDFFAIVEPGYKDLYLDDLEWLSRLCPIAYHFRNTVDGFKLLYTDGVFCEFAVFEPGELANAAFAPGRLIWKREDVDASIGAPAEKSAPPDPPREEWLVGEALTNLYVGLGRCRRGEKLSAMRFIQGYAVDRVLDLYGLKAEPDNQGDPFAPERRVERRFPELAGTLAQFNQGYERSPQSASAILDYLDTNYALNPAIVAAIRELLDRRE